ncbi:DoxX family protein [Salmonirosea aquatica]|uniref:DoxX family membrane protein n=1 Tax=Salmonirosea aquatica TaxID=2654236 RepID=A0A7C9BJ61_9BACT|nr:DoxX family membrane protein [Cytophagaceae bacterium SJW1-29]
MIRRIFSPPTLPDPASWGVLILRVGMGFFMATHGYDKLSSYLGGNSGFADPIGLGEETSLILTIFSEFFCALLLMLGLFTRAALIPLLIGMLVVSFVVHGGEPLSEREHALMFAVAFVAIFLTGPGRYSADQVLFK